MENLMLKNVARSLVVAGFITFAAVGVASAAGAGDQTGQGAETCRDMADPWIKRQVPGAGTKPGPAPEPSAYQKPGAAGSGYSGGTKPRAGRNS